MRFPTFGMGVLRRPRSPSRSARPTLALPSRPVLRLPASALRALVCASLAAGCSPAYNWRTVTDAGEGYTIELPAKPTIDERGVDIAGATLPMHVRAARTQGAVFAIAAIDLPRDDAPLREAVADALRSALARNVGASPVEHAIQVPLDGGAAVPGAELIVTGKAGQSRDQRTIHAWIVGRGRHVYQAAIVSEHTPPQEQVEQFFGSLKLQ